MSAPVKRVLGHDFRPMTQLDWCTFAGADEGTLICEYEDTTLLLTPGGLIVEVSEDGREVEWVRGDAR